MLKINLVNESNNPIPEFATSGSSGFDIRAFLEEDFILKSGDRAAIPTGLYFEITNI